MTQTESPPVHIDFLNRLDISRLELTDEEIITAVELGLAMQGKGETAIEPRVHLEPRAGVEGHFNVLRGWIGGQIGQAGVKIVGDFVGNYKEGRPSEYGLRTRRKAPRTAGIKDIGPHRCTRNLLLERKTAGSALQFR